MRRICVVGHSHMTALQKSCSSDRTTENAYRFIQLHGKGDFTPVVTNGVLNSALLKEISAAPFDALVSMAAGNDHALFGLLNHPVKFDFVLPDRPDIPLQEGAELVPFQSVVTQLETRIRRWAEWFAALRKVTDSVILHIESPPPVPCEAHIRKYPGVFADKIDELGVAPAPFRYKLWRLQSALFQRFCDENGIRFVPAPAAMRDENDMLVREAWNPDPTHGNAVYGMHVRAVIDVTLENKPEKATTSPVSPTRATQV